jgi:hypothetical protein
MKTSLRGLAPAALVALMAGCSTAKPAVTQPVAVAAPECPGPAWTCFQSGPCPFAEFKGSICAVGTADQIASYSLGMEAAKTRARREMAAVIQTKVDGFTRVVQDSVSKSGQGEESIQKVGDLSQSIVERSLNGVSVPKTWYNTQTRVYFAIAVLDSDTLVTALKGLKEAKGMADATKQEIDARAANVVSDWQNELARKNAADMPAPTPGR